MSANFIARELGYRMTEGWGQGHQALADWFGPAETFPERFDALLAEVAAMGFGAIDLYLGHLDPRLWAGEAHIEAAKDLLRRRGLSVASLAGGFGVTPDELERTCALADALDVDIFGGSCALFKDDRAAAVEILRRRGKRLALENHPEKTPEALFERMGEGDEDVVGAAVDTGWFGTQGYDAADALEALYERTFVVHLKDIRPPDPAAAPGKTLKSIGHETCALGDGAVPVERCVQILRERNYAGPISIEHEPEDFDPTDDCVVSLKRLQGWLSIK